MRIRVILLCAVLCAPFLFNLFRSERWDLAALEVRAAALRRQENVAQRSQVAVFYDLADAYRAAGRQQERRSTLSHALSLDPGNASRQLEVAELEVAAGSLPAAHDRLMAVGESAPDDSVRARAAALADELRARGFEPPTMAPPRVVDRWLVFLVFDGTDRSLVAPLAERVGAAFGVRTRVLDSAVAPVQAGARDSSGAPGTRQLDADQLIGQIVAVAQDTLSKPDVLGVIGVTATDLYADRLNFVFGTAATRAGVLSLARFGRPGEPREALLSRATKQAFSTAGFVLGVPRCSSSSCARAYPHSLAEMDRKGHSLCRTCRQSVDRALDRGR